MLSLIDESLEAFLRAEAPLSAVDIDVSFVSPTDEWSGKLTRPTVNLHLWDVRRSAQRALAGRETYERDGVMMQRFPLPRVELRYAVTGWASDPSDERLLLGSVLIALLRHDAIPAGFIVERISHLPAPTIQVAKPGEETRMHKQGERLALQCCVTAVVDTGAGEPLAAPPSEIGLGMTDTESGATSSPPRRIAGEVLGDGFAGATVITPRGSALVNEAGRFLVKAAPGDTIVIDGPTRLEVVAPAEGGVRVEAG